MFEIPVPNVEALLVGLAPQVDLHHGHLPKESLGCELRQSLLRRSLVARRPAMFCPGRSFATGGDPEKMAEFDKRLEIPSVPGRFRLVTAIRGLGLVGEA